MSQYSDGKELGARDYLSILCIYNSNVDQKQEIMIFSSGNS